MSNEEEKRCAQHEDVERGICDVCNNTCSVAIIHKVRGVARICLDCAELAVDKLREARRG